MKFVIKFCSIAIMSFMIGGFGLGRPAFANGDVLCSTFPVYLFTKAVTDGYRDDVSLMLDSALGCPHDYALTPSELERLSRAKILIINGLGLESFLNRALSVAGDDLQVIDSSGGASVDSPEGKPPVFVMTKKQAIESADSWAPHGAEYDPRGGGAGHKHGPLNAHLFASPASAAVMVANIAAGLAAVDPEGAEVYGRNAEKSVEELRELAVQMRDVGAGFGNPKVIISHSIFVYFARDVGLSVFASIEEEDGAEPSAARLAELARTARQEGVKAILVDPDGNRRLAKTLGDETGIPVVIIDVAASGPADASLDYYLSVMNSNLERLRETLEGGKQ